MSYHLVLTGASGGLGAAFARRLAAHSRSMTLTGRDAERLHAVAARVRGAHPNLEVRTVAGELADPRTPDAILDAIRSTGGSVDLLINNAGANDFHAFESQPFATVESVLETNLLAPMRLIQRLLPLLKAAPRAQIVNIGSVFGYLGYPGYAVYCASKFGLRGFSQALARELADSGVSVRYFAPRFTRTALNGHAAERLNVALKVRADTPEQVAAALARFLESGRREQCLGFPERLYVALNQMLPRINDSAIRAQLATIRQHLPGYAASGTHPTDQGATR